MMLLSWWTLRTDSNFSSNFKLILDFYVQETSWIILCLWELESKVNRYHQNHPVTFNFRNNKTCKDKLIHRNKTKLTFSEIFSNVKDNISNSRRKQRENIQTSKSLTKSLGNTLMTMRIFQEGFIVSVSSIICKSSISINIWNYNLRRYSKAEVTSAV